LRDAISLDDLLIKNRTATFLLRVSGDSMVRAGIMPGDLVLIDRSATARDGDIVIAEVDNQWTMKRLRQHGGRITLEAANPAYSPIRPREELRIAGVVTAVIRKYR
jgi:repressor LexA